MDPLRFALLEHTTADGVHWDLLLEARDQPGLPTWRLYRDPRAGPAAVPCERIADHRRLYLEYEGPLSRGRGSVRRLDDGCVEWTALSGDEAAFVLRGRTLSGRFRIIRRGGGLVFEPEPG